MKNIVANYQIPSYHGGDTADNLEKWRGKAKEIQITQPWLDDETAMMEAKKQIFGMSDNGRG